MDRAIARLNIEHYRRQLTTKLEEAKRRMIERLLVEEETKLAAPQGDTLKSERER